MRVKLSKSAENDLLNAFWFYENQNDGIGNYFKSSVGTDIESLKIYGGIHPTVHGYHRMVCKTFPYNIYYRIASESLVEVIAIIAHRENRHPTKNVG